MTEIAKFTFINPLQIPQNDFSRIAKNVYNIGGDKLEALRELYGKYGYKALILSIDNIPDALCVYQVSVRGHIDGVCAYIDLIAVTDDQRRKGFAKLMVDRLKRNYNQVVCSCPLDSKSNGFYHRAGFKKRAFEYVL
jgi:GNAT superfamily N-acetyltransferase